MHRSAPVFIMDQTSIKKSIKHREKIQNLMQRGLSGVRLTKVRPPLKYFATDKSLSIGAGSNGTSVFVGIMQDGSEVAVKRMLVNSCEALAENEKKILINTKKSPFIVSYRHFFRDKTFVYLIVDLCEETLKDHVSSQSTEYLQRHDRRMIKEILTGLDFLHNHGILHRDLKPSNVLVDVGGHMRLADFGISRILNEDETTVLTDAKGTQGWMAREVIETIREGGKGRFKKKCDIQVAGMVAYFILTKGGHPFGGPFERMVNIVNGNPVHLDKIDDHGGHWFVSWLISHNIKDRPYAHVALNALKHLGKGNDRGQLSIWNGMQWEELALPNFQLEVFVDPKYRKKIMGRKGVIDKIRNDHDVNVQIQFPSMKPGDDDGRSGVITLTGYKRNCQAAKERIERLVEELKQHISKVYIDPTVHLRLIEERGPSICRMMEKFNVDIRFPPSDNPNAPILISGAPDNVDEAKDHLLLLGEEYLDEVSEPAEEMDHYLHPPSRNNAVPRNNPSPPISPRSPPAVPNLADFHDFPAFGSSRKPFAGAVWGPKRK